MQEIKNINYLLSLEKTLGVACFSKHLDNLIPNFKINSEFVNTFSKYANENWSLSDLDHDALMFLLKNNLFNVDKYCSNSNKKDTSIFADKDIETSYSDILIKVLNTINKIPYTLLNYYIDKDTIDESTKYSLLHQYSDSKNISNYALKYAYLIGPEISKIVGNSVYDEKSDIFKSLFLSDNKNIDLFLIIDVMARTKKSDIWNTVLNDVKITNYYFDIITKKEMDNLTNNIAMSNSNGYTNDNENLTLPELLSKQQNASYQNLDSESYYDISQEYKNFLYIKRKKLINIIKRYDSEISEKLINNLRMTANNVLIHHAVLKLILRKDFSEQLLIDLINDYKLCGIEKELQDYAHEKNYELLLLSLSLPTT